MGDFNIDNISQDIDYGNSTFDYEHDAGHHTEFLIFNVVIIIILSISVPLTLVAIYALYSQVCTKCLDILRPKVRNDKVVSIYIISLLISDLIQICSIIAQMTISVRISASFYAFGVLASVCFMVLIAMERYLVIACPLWYHFRRTIKLSVVICVSAWVISLVCTVTFMYWNQTIIYGIYFLLPLPLFIFFLGGTIRALSASTLPPDEKRRIVAILVVVLLIYTLLFVPTAIWFLVDGFLNITQSLLSQVFLFLSPLADLFLYVFMRKGVTEKLSASVCCCKMDNNDVSSSTV